MLATHLGWFNTASTRTHVRFQFSTHNAAGANVAPSTAIDAADIRIYKAADGAAFSATQRSSANGITCTSPFDSLTGFHDVDIDLTDNTDAGFYAAGSFYSVVLAPNDETIDSQTITGVVLGYFEIGVNPVNVTQFGGTAGTFASGRPEVNTSHISGDSTAADNLELAFDDTAGAVPMLGVLDQGTAQSATATTLVLRAATPFGSDDACNGATLWAFGSDQGYWQARLITDYTTADDTATVSTWDVTPSGTITYKVFGTAPQTASGSGATAQEVWEYSDRQLTALDEGVTTIDLNGTTIGTATNVTTVNGLANNVITALSINADAFTAAKFAADVTTELQSGLATAAALDAVDNFLDTEIAAIKAVTDLLPDAGALTSLATQASVNTIDDFLDTEIAAIKAKTDSLTFTTAGLVDSNVQQINDVTITGDGQVGTEFGV